MDGQNILRILQKDPRYKDLQGIFSTLQSAGHEIYLVGGCVRDALLGREIHDYDFATSAKPDETRSLFAKTLNHGKAFGTITVVTSSAHYEVTTFRLDMNYNDHRRPESINYSDSYVEDSKRRDFTINALYANSKGEVLDPQEGLRDLKAKILKCVGGDDLRGAEERFREDALRMYRALRFASQLDFQIEALTLEALTSLWPLTAHISKERRYQEFKKMVDAPYFAHHLPMIFEKRFLPWPTDPINSSYLCLRMKQAWGFNVRFKIFLLEWMRLQSKTKDMAEEMFAGLKQTLSLTKEEGKWLSVALGLLYSEKLRTDGEGLLRSDQKKPAPATPHLLRTAVKEILHSDTSIAAVELFLSWGSLLDVKEMKLFFILNVNLQEYIQEDVLVQLRGLLAKHTEMPKPLVKAQDILSDTLKGQKLGEALSEIYKQQILLGITKKEPLLQWFFNQKD
ncbi:MAG: hypothetical protein M9899_09600 [Bdellovibrionaceae bacterium]|nr:hypothetical protein [Pseudobdellovibrionaceae bacterium]